jgi:hypothetical protein
MAGHDSNDTSASEPVTAHRWWDQSSNRVLVFSAAIYVVVGGLMLLFLPGPLLANWLPGSTAADRGKLLGTAAQILLLGLGGVIAVIGVTLSVARHQEELASQERDRTRLADDRAKEAARRQEWEHQRRTDAEREFRARFVSTVDLLSSSDAIKRTAALYALAALADDWDAHSRPDEVQVCIHTLCGYLRAPWEENSGSGEESVRSAGYAILSAHLAKDAAHWWGGNTLDLRGAPIHSRLDLGRATIGGHGKVSLDRATISGNGTVSLAGALISDHGKVSLDRVTISRGGAVSLVGAIVSDQGRVFLTSATMSDHSEISLNRATIRGQGKVYLAGATISDRARVSFHGATVSDQGMVSFYDVTISDHGMVDFYDLTISGHGRVMLDRATISDQAEIFLRDATISAAGSVTFTGATVSEHGSVLLSGATMGGTGPITLPGGEYLTLPARW